MHACRQASTRTFGTIGVTTPISLCLHQVRGLNYNDATCVLSEATASGKPMKLIIRAATHEPSVVHVAATARPQVGPEEVCGCVVCVSVCLSVCVSLSGCVWLCLSAKHHIFLSQFLASYPYCTQLIQTFRITRRALDEPIGMRVRGGLPECSDAFVVEVDPGSRASLAGLRPGLRLVSHSQTASSLRPF